MIFSLFFFFFFVCQDIKAQVEKRTQFSKKDPASANKTEIGLDTYEKPDWKTIDINFLSSYYSQDGSHGAVTGGIGTERLTDFTQKIIVSIPTSPKLSLNIDAGYDYYSSASTDNIDFIRASDSAQDMRVHGNMGFTYQANEQHAFGLRIGGSGEYDYTSLSGGLTYNWLSKDQNSSIGLSTQAFIDKWILYYPVELRREGRLVPTDRRQSYNATLTFTQVLTKKLQIAVQLEGIYMNGLLSTPFHRVYFQEQNRAKVESLPSTRLKIPIGIRLNSYLSENLISRLYYRYYSDDWGVKGHSISLELPVKLNRFMAVYPMYRFHTQTGSDYFLPYKQHTLDSEFYTSDFDLSELSSHSFGIGFTYSPSNGMGRSKLPFAKNTSIIWDGIDIKFSHYRRSTDLTANIVSLGMKFSIR